MRINGKIAKIKPNGMMIGMKILPLNMSKRIDVEPTFRKRPVNVPNKVFTITTFPTKEGAALRTFFCVE